MAPGRSFSTSYRRKSTASEGHNLETPSDQARAPSTSTADHSSGPPLRVFSGSTSHRRHTTECRIPGTHVLLLRALPGQSSPAASTSARGEAPGPCDLAPLFRLMDRDGDGRICADELAQLLKTFGEENCDAAARAMIGGADSDGDGLVSLEDFVRVLSAAQQPYAGRHGCPCPTVPPRGVCSSPAACAGSLESAPGVDGSWAKGGLLSGKFPEDCREGALGPASPYQRAQWPLDAGNLCTLTAVEHTVFDPPAGELVHPLRKPEDSGDGRECLRDDVQYSDSDELMFFDAMVDSPGSERRAGDEEMFSVGGGVAEYSARELRATFDLFDQDGDGFIREEELYSVLCGIWGEEVTIDECEAIVANADRDGDGAVGFDDFVEIMLSGGLMGGAPAGLSPGLGGKPAAASGLGEGRGGETGPTKRKSSLSAPLRWFGFAGN